MVLDVMLPGFDGLEVCRRIRGQRDFPVLMLTARSDETDLLVGLGVGADDYLSKPFSVRELVARVHARLRRTGRVAESDQVVLGDLVVDLAASRTHVRGVEVHLTGKDLSLLKSLLEGADPLA